VIGATEPDLATQDVGELAPSLALLVQTIEREDRARRRRGARAV
jgi:hypothetical protein